MGQRMRRLCLLFLWVTCTQPGCSRTASDNAMLRANPTPDAALATDVAPKRDIAAATDAAAATDDFLNPLGRVGEL